MYIPHFVTETDETHWTDCTWASAVMFIDAWTLGQVIVDRERLRAASGDTIGGSNLGDVARGIDALLPNLPSLYRPTTWTAADVVNYLQNNGTIIAQGLYSSIRYISSGRYVRWDPTFATKGSNSGHAVHVTGYKIVDNVRYVFWQDPLGRGTYKGEWVPLTVLVTFLNSLRRSNGSVYVAAAKVGAAAVAPDTSTGGPMYFYRFIAQTGRFTIPAGKSVRGYKAGLTDWVVVKTWPARSESSSAPFSARVSRMSGDVTPSVLLYVPDGFFEGLYVSTADVVEVYDNDDTPYDRDDIDAAVKAALAAQAAALATAQAALTTEKSKVATLTSQLSAITAQLSALKTKAAAALAKAKELVISLTP